MEKTEDYSIMYKKINLEKFLELENLKSQSTVILHSQESLPVRQFMDSVCPVLSQLGT